MIDPLRLTAIDQLSTFGVDLSPEFRSALEPRPLVKIVTGGVQAGKSTEAACEVAVPVIELGLKLALNLTQNRSYLYWVVMPTYRTPPKEMQYMAGWFRQMGILTKEHWPDGGSARLELLGGKVVIETRTSQDPEGIASEAVDGILVVETGQQPENIYTACLDRTVTRNGWITLTGTLEDEEAKPRYAWYGDLASRWQDSHDEEHAAYRLPTWANRSVFPEGRRDARFERRLRELGQYTFDRRYGGIPRGSQFPIYPMAQQNTESYEDEELAGYWHHEPEPILSSLGAGGLDYGTTQGHPSTLVAVTFTAREPHIAVVRDAWEEQTGDASLIESRRRLMSQRWNIPNRRWGFDPLLKMAASQVGAEAVTMEERLRRVGLVEARLNNETLKFDLRARDNSTGEKERVRRVIQVLRQLGRVHYIKRSSPSGEKWEYHRDQDDLVASLENAVKIMDRPAYDPRKPLAVGNTSWGTRR